MSTADAGTWAKTACILCECNCGLEVQVEDRQLVKIRGDKQHPGSQGYSCEKPLRLEKYQNGPHRIDTPMRRRPDGTYEEIGWDTALDEIATKLAAVRDTYGGETIFYYGGGGQGNHLGGAYGRSLLAAVGGRFLGNALAQEKTGEGWVDQQLLGNHTTGDFERSEVAIFIGKNPWQSHGMARARPVLKEIARDPDRTMIVIDPRRSETAAMADLHLQLKPGTDAWCVSAIVATIAQEGLADQAWLAEHATGVDDVLRALSEIDIPAHAARCGVPEELIRAAARRIATASSAATYEDLGVQHSPNSTLVSYLNKMMWLLTGNYGKPGAQHMHSWMFPIAGAWRPVPSSSRRRAAPAAMSVLTPMVAAGMRLAATPLRRLLAAIPSTRAARVAGSADRAADGLLRTFFASVAVPSARPMVDALSLQHVNGTAPVSGARVINGLLPCNAIADEVLSEHPERLRAMWIDASNPAHSLADSARFREAMRALEVSVVIDVAFTETAGQADYVLPAASQFEKHEASLFTLHFPHNTFQLRRPLMDPLPGTRPEPEIYAAVIDRLAPVDDQLLTELRAAAEVGRKAFALAFFSTMQSRPELAGLSPYLLYRTLGTTMPPGEQPLALVWGMAHLCAIYQPDAVARAGFDARGFARGEQLFEAICEHHEGVLFSEDDYGHAWDYLHHADGKIRAAIPELLDELRRVVAGEPDPGSAEFPFILSAGERRSFTANVIIRNPAWRRRDPQGALRMSEHDAGELSVTDGDEVRIVTSTGTARAVVEVSDMMQQGHISLPNGMGVTYPDTDHGDPVGDAVGVAPNSLTDATRRDRFFGTPWHKNVPARVEPIRAHRRVETATAQASPSG